MFDWLWDFISKLLDWVVGLLPTWLGNGWAELSSYFGPTAKYIAYISGLDAVVPVVISAVIIRFFIRRIPVVG